VSAAVVVEEAESLTERLQALFLSPGYRPPVLPGVALQIVELAQRPNVGFGEVVAVLETDPLLAGRVLSVAQSALYAGMSQVVSLKQATVRLGLKTLRDLVLEAAMNLRVFRVPGYEGPMERLRRHSSVVAQLARVVCKRTVVDAEHAFVCGLLHDVGFAAGVLALVEDRRSGAPGAPLPFDALAPAVMSVHEEAAALVARLWKLPDEIQWVVGAHHRLGPRSHPLVPVLIVAEQLAYELDAGLTPVAWPEDAGDELPAPPPGALDANGPEVVREALRVLRVEAAALESLRAEALETFLKMPEGAGAKPSAAPPQRGRR
jgi:putative nucleotidyltransferase with HDIG domain